MISLRKSALEIVNNNPENAVPLYDALLFMEQKSAVLSPEFDETKEMLYAMTLDSQKHREIYEKSRAAAA